MEQEACVIQPGGRHRDDGRTRPRQRYHPKAGGTDTRHQPRAGVGNAGRAGVHYQSDRVAGGEFADDPLRGRFLVVLVGCQQARRAAQLPQQGTAVTRILGGDPGHLSQDFQRSLSDIAEMTDRRGNQI